MIIQRSRPTGVDRKIDLIQRWIDKHQRWGSAAIYGRLHVTERGDYSVFEHIGANGQANEVFVDDKQQVIIGFYVESQGTEMPLAATVRIIFSFNIQKILSTTGYTVEDLHLQAMSMLAKCGYIESTGNIMLTLDEALADSTVERYKYRDMFPYHTFAIPITISYIGAC